MSYGLDGFFSRPHYLATDDATSHHVWKHAFHVAEEHYKETFTISILLEPTSPLRRVSDLFETVLKVASGGYSAAITVSPTPASYTPHKTLELNQDGILKFYREDGKNFSLRQKIPQYYHRNGVCYAAKRETLLDEKLNTIIESDCAGVVIDQPVVNIDEPIDLEYAAWLLSRREKDD